MYQICTKQFILCLFHSFSVFLIFLLSVSLVVTTLHGTCIVSFVFRHFLHLPLLLIQHHCPFEICEYCIVFVYQPKAIQLKLKVLALNPLFCQIAKLA